jgi:alpha-D-xyloside xylohydrolase
VYLPPSPKWYDFWTGDSTKDGQEIEADAPLDRVPPYVHAGSILPMGPEIEYAAQDPGSSIELRIYRGADGAFNLYDDAGDSYEYEHGQHAVIPTLWNDSAGVLTIGAREGSYPGMAKRALSESSTSEALTGLVATRQPRLIRSSRTTVRRFT